jgi:hypothetical protein
MAQKNERLSIKVLLPPCRMSFPWLFKPQETDNGDKFQLNMLFPPKTDFKKFEDALYDVMEDMFGKDSKKWPRGGTNRGPDQVIRDATEKDYEGYKPGWFFVKASSKDPVGIVDARREQVTNEREVYGGRWCRCSVTVVAYDNKSKGVGVYLNSVQLLDHDEQFGGRGPAKNDFEDWDETERLSDDERGTGTGTSVRDARGRDDAEDDRDRGRDRDRGTRSSRDEPEDNPRSRDRGREDTRDRDRDAPADTDRTRRSREPEDDRGSRRRDDDVRGSGGRDSRDRDDDRGRGRDRDTDERPSGRRSARDEEWN